MPIGNWLISFIFLLPTSVFIFPTKNKPRPFGYNLIWKKQGRRYIFIFLGDAVFGENV